MACRSEPEYLCAWYSRNAGMERIDEWERVFRSGDADLFEEPFRLAARIDAAGCYEPLLEPVVGSKGRYYAEWFDLAPGADHDAVRSSYAARRQAHADLELNLLVDRIGKLGPDSRGLAVWASRPGGRSRASPGTSTTSTTRSGWSPSRSTRTSVRSSCDTRHRPVRRPSRHRNRGIGGDRPV